MRFDPFNDRVARNIRNSLSSALVGELTQVGSTTVSGVADDWRSQQPDDVYRHYIDARQHQYQKVLTRIRANRIDAPQHQTILLWNDGLYFELHELLETIWRGAAEPERTGLKGLIQAAGAYLHSRRGEIETAVKLARRAGAHLRAGATALAFIANLEQLIEALAATPPTPLQLVYKVRGKN